MHDLGTIQVAATELISGEALQNTEWAKVALIKYYTNCFILDEENKKVLLGYKKRGFGQGLYNGFGGKVEAFFCRDTQSISYQEESGISSTLTHAGTLLFTSSASTMMYHIEVYRGLEWVGDIIETEEMRPQWFSIPEYAYTEATGLSLSPIPTDMSLALPPIPFDKMWLDDQLWFPYLLSKRLFVGRVDFGAPTDEDDLNTAPIMKWWFGEPIGVDPSV